MREHPIGGGDARRYLRGATRSAYLLKRLPESERGPLMQDSPHWVQYVVSFCAHCSESVYLTVNEITHSLDSKGNPKKDTKAVCEHVRLNQKDMEQLSAEASQQV